MEFEDQEFLNPDELVTDVDLNNFNFSDSNFFDQKEICDDAVICGGDNNNDIVYDCNNNNDIVDDVVVVVDETFNVVKDGNDVYGEDLQKENEQNKNPKSNHEQRPIIIMECPFCNYKFEKSKGMYNIKRYKVKFCKNCNAILTQKNATFALIVDSISPEVRNFLPEKIKSRKETGIYSKQPGNAAKKAATELWRNIKKYTQDNKIDLDIVPKSFEITIRRRKFIKYRPISLSNGKYPTAEDFENVKNLEKKILLPKVFRYKIDMTLKEISQEVASLLKNKSKYLWVSNARSIKID